jgi:hypothetical protein
MTGNLTRLKAAPSAWIPYNSVAQLTTGVYGLLILDTRLDMATTSRTKTGTAFLVLLVCNSGWACTEGFTAS